MGEKRHDPPSGLVRAAVDAALKASPGTEAPTRADLERIVRQYTSVRVKDAPVRPGVERIIIDASDTRPPTSGRSVKLRNLRFNLGTLLEAVSSGVAAVLAASVSPLTAILTGLLAIRELVQAATVKLTEREALAIWSLWSCEQRGEQPTAETILSRCLADAAQFGAPFPTTGPEVGRVLDRLRRIGAIRRLPDGTWQTVETVAARM